MHPSKRALVLSILVLAFLAALRAVPASADETAAPVVAAGCGLNLDALASPEAGACPAVTPENPQPSFMAPKPRRGYCRCGCGGGCTTDADCGPGGSCVAFITCC